jgi:hypothetical protein
MSIKTNEIGLNCHVSGNDLFRAELSPPDARNFMQISSLQPSLRSRHRPALATEMPV